MSGYTAGKLTFRDWNFDDLDSADEHYLDCEAISRFRDAFPRDCIICSDGEVVVEIDDPDEMDEVESVDEIWDEVKSQVRKEYCNGTLTIK